MQQDEYVPGLADAAGIRVVVHNKSDMPFPEDEGFSLAPGTLTYVGLERVRELGAVRFCASELGSDSGARHSHSFLAQFPPQSQTLVL